MICWVWRAEDVYLYIFFILLKYDIASIVALQSDFDRVMIIIRTTLLHVRTPPTRCI